MLQFPRVPHFLALSTLNYSAFSCAPNVPDNLNEFHSARYRLPFLEIFRLVDEIHMHMSREGKLLIFDYCFPNTIHYNCLMHMSFCLECLWLKMYLLVEVLFGIMC